LQEKGLSTARFFDRGKIKSLYLFDERKDTTYFKEKDIEINEMIPEVNELESETLISILAKFFKSKEYVELAYLFGSHAKGKSGPLSDIDIGIYLSRKLDKKDRFEKRLELIGFLSTLLQTNNFDLVVMNDSPPVLNFEIIKPNCLIFEKNHDLRVEIEISIMSMYYDRKPHEELLNRAFVNRFKKRGFS
jgi:predicted nucleotidyltransferase